MANLLRLSACLFVLLSFNVKALVINGCTIEPYTSCVSADLTFANLTDADLSGANLFFAYLIDANLTGVDLSFTNLINANLSGALYNDQTVLDFDPVAAGMSYVPVPAAAWLFGIALLGLGLVRRR